MSLAAKIFIDTNSVIRVYGSSRLSGLFEKRGRVMTARPCVKPPSRHFGIAARPSRAIPDRPARRGGSLTKRDSLRRSLFRALSRSRCRSQRRRIAKALADVQIRWEEFASFVGQVAL